jgi:hypothetical protein
MLAAVIVGPKKLHHLHHNALGRGVLKSTSGDSKEQLAPTGYMLNTSTPQDLEKLPLCPIYT